MKYLYLLPVTIVVLVSHYYTYIGYLAYKIDGDVFHFNPMFTAIVFVFWIMISIIGVFKFSNE